MPDLYIIGGPNGAGKTTAAFDLLPEVFTTLNLSTRMKSREGYPRLIPKELQSRQGE